MANGLGLEEVTTLLTNIDPTKAVGNDSISGRMLKAAAYSIGLSVNCRLFNNLLLNLKISSIVPIPKGGAKNDVKKYRPISLLPCLSKLLERHMYNLLMEPVV